MKKLTFGFMAFALAAATLFTSCNKDDDDDDNSLKNLASITATINGEKFSATAAANTSVSESATGSKFSLADILSDSDAKTTIYGVNSAKQFISVTFNGADKGTYALSLKAETNTTNLIIDYLTNGSLEETAKNALKLETNCMIIYKKSEAATDATSEDFYASTKAEVIVTGFNQIGSISYLKGTFTATLKNKSGDEITITDGAFQCPGK